jgi:transcriptional regulator with XRE-family HTH domain
MMKSLKAMREKIGWSRAQLALKANVAEQTISNIEESRVSWPQADVRYNIEVAFGMRINWLATIDAYGTASKMSWEKAEETLRVLLINASRFSENERAQFMAMAHDYLETFDAYTKLAEMEDSEQPLYPIEFGQSLRRRKEGY